LALLAPHSLFFRPFSPHFSRDTRGSLHRSIRMIQTVLISSHVRWPRLQMPVTDTENVMHTRLNERETKTDFESI
jgi:hypothetical protein